MSNDKDVKIHLLTEIYAGLRRASNYLSRLLTEDDKLAWALTNYRDPYAVMRELDRMGSEAANLATKEELARAGVIFSTRNPFEGGSEKQ